MTTTPVAGNRSRKAVVPDVPPKRVRNRQYALDVLNDDYRSNPNFAHLRYRARFVPGQGSTRPRVMFVGDLPTKEEERLGLPYVGPVGRVLDDMLRSVDLKREHVYVTHILKYPTPANRDPKPDEVRAAVQMLQREIRILKPPVIVPLGRFPLSILVPGAHITAVHGDLIHAKGRVIVPILNPVSVIVNPALRKMVFDDMQKVAEIA